MKLLLLSLYELSTKDHFLKVLKDAMDVHSEISILADIKEGQGISEIEGNLYGALMNGNLDVAVQALHSLKDIYRNRGKIPTKTSSGLFNMLRLLEEVEEFIFVVSTQN